MDLPRRYRRIPAPRTWREPTVERLAEQAGHAQAALANLAAVGATPAALDAVARSCRAVAATARDLKRPPRREW
jgi:hypothetical protein